MAVRMALANLTPLTDGVYPWAGVGEWMEVSEWLYSSDKDLIRRGVSRVAAWRARGAVPLPVEMTADMLDCRLRDELDETGRCGVGAGTSLMYSMAITRFVNALSDTMAVCSGNSSGDRIAKVVRRCGVPPWIVSLRHAGTHHGLPSLSSLRGGVNFALEWFQLWYWRPQKEILIERGLLVRSGEGEGWMEKDTEEVAEVEEEEGEEEEVCEEAMKPSKMVSRIFNRMHYSGVWKESQATRIGKAFCRGQSPRVLAESVYRGLLLGLPYGTEWTVEVPLRDDLESLPVLQGASGQSPAHQLWRKVLSTACGRALQLKQRLMIALITAIHRAGCPPSRRDAVAGWLNMLLKEEAVGKSPVRSSKKSRRHFPGPVNWRKLLSVAHAHPGFYTSAIVKIILSHLSHVISESVRDKLARLAGLITLSERVGNSAHVVSGCGGSKLLDLLTSALCDEQHGEEDEQPVAMEERREMEKQRWKVCKDSRSWHGCPLGLCPGQRLSPTLLDLPAELDSRVSEHEQAAEPMMTEEVQEEEKEKEEEEEEQRGPVLCPALVDHHFYSFFVNRTNTEAIQEKKAEEEEEEKADSAAPSPMDCHVTEQEKITKPHHLKRGRRKRKKMADETVVVPWHSRGRGSSKDSIVAPVSASANEHNDIGMPKRKRRKR